MIRLLVTKDINRRRFDIAFRCKMGVQYKILPKNNRTWRLLHGTYNDSVFFQLERLSRVWIPIANEMSWGDL